MAQFTDQSDVIISISYAIENSRAAIAKAKQAIQKLSNYKQDLTEHTMPSLKNLGISRKDQGMLRKYFKDQKNLRLDATKNAIKTVKRQQQVEQNRLAGYQTQMRKATSLQKQFEGQQKKIRGQFQGWALSIMFFGQLIVRMLTQMWTASAKVFNDVMHSVEGTVTEFDKLEGSMTYLKFVMGAALEPLAAALYPLIDSLSEWIMNNEEIIRQIVPMAAAFGLIIMSVGTLVLGVHGLLSTLRLIFGVASSMSALGIFAIFAGLGALTWKSFKETPEAWESIKDSVKSMKEPLKDFVDSLDDIVAQFTPFEGLYEMIAWTGAWAFDMVTRAAQNLLAILSLVMDSFTVIAKQRDLDLAYDLSADERLEAMKEIEAIQNRMSVNKGLIRQNGDIGFESVSAFKDRTLAAQESAALVGGAAETTNYVYAPNTVDPTDIGMESTADVFDKINSYIQIPTDK